MKTPLSRFSSFWSFGLVIGALVACGVTLFVTVWEWIENPGGIFRGAEETHWRFVYETAVSWLAPTFLYAAVAASAMHLAYSGIRAALRRRRAGRSGSAGG